MNSLIRILSLLWAFPPNRWLLAVIAVLSPVMALSGSTVPMILFLLAIVLYLRIYRQCNSGRSSRLVAQISPNFFAVRSMSGRRFIFQRRQPGQPDCRSIFKSLLEERKLVDTLPPGCYRAITHETVLSRIERSERMHITSCKPVYRNSMQSILTDMTSGRCRHCEHRCSAWTSVPRQFYEVNFSVFPAMRDDIRKVEP